MPFRKGIIEMILTKFTGSRNSRRFLSLSCSISVMGTWQELETVSSWQRSLSRLQLIWLSLIRSGAGAKLLQADVFLVHKFTVGVVGLLLLCRYFYGECTFMTRPKTYYWSNRSQKFNEFIETVLINLENIFENIFELTLKNHSCMWDDES